MSWKDTLMRFPGIRKVSTLRTKLSARWYDWRYMSKPAVMKIRAN